MIDPLSKQIGGTHYKGDGIQPIVFATANFYDPGAFSILKYITRHAKKDGRKDLHKAKHFCFLRLAAMPKGGARSALSMISVDDYAETNDLGPYEKSILSDLHHWSTLRFQIATDEQAANWIAHKIEYLSEITYGKE